MKGPLSGHLRRCCWSDAEGQLLQNSCHSAFAVKPSLVVKGRREQLAGANKKVAGGTWHALALKAEGITSASAEGRGIARQMCEQSLIHAKSRGYRAMQFNFVVSANERAVRLWQSMGIEIVGRLPLAFHHLGRGYVDAFVMFRHL